MDYGGINAGYEAQVCNQRRRIRKIVEFFREIDQFKSAKDFR